MVLSSCTGPRPSEGFPCDSHMPGLYLPESVSRSSSRNCYLPSQSDQSLTEDGVVRVKCFVQSTNRQSKAKHLIDIPPTPPPLQGGERLATQSFGSPVSADGEHRVTSQWNVSPRLCDCWMNVLWHVEIVVICVQASEQPGSDGFFSL